MTLRSLSLITCLLGFASNAVAGSGELTGTVTAGPHAQPIANARVLLRAGDQLKTARTDALGRYQFPPLEAGVPYEMTVDADGLRTLTRSGVVLGEGEITRVDVNLELADVRDSIVVTGAATDWSVVARSVTEDDVADLPSVTRSTTKYALLDPHVRQVLGLGADFQDASRLSVNAGSYRHTGYMLDGASTYDWIYANSPQVAVSPNAVQEMKVLTGQYSAQYGLSTTGVLAITTASGGNQIRGEGFLFARPSGLQARPPLSVFEVPNERTDGGFNAGGPLARERTHFFGSYERAEQDRGAYIQSPAPRFFVGHTLEQYGLIRVDHRLTADHALTVRVNGSEYTTDNANDRVSGFNQPNFGRTSHIQSVGGQVTDRAIFGAAVNELRVSFNAYVPDSATPLVPSVQIVRPNYASEGFSTTNWVHGRTFQASDVFAFHRGRHDVKFGGEIVRVNARDYSFTPFGTYTFAPGAPQPGEHPLTYSQTFGVVDLSYAQTQASAFVQDDVRVSPRVTASLGLRYEMQSITDARANFGPRLGAVWDVAGSGRTVVRSGFGIFYDQYYMYLTRRYITLGPRSPQASYTWSWGDAGFPEFPNSLTAVPEGKLAGSRDIQIPGDRLLNPHSHQVSLSLEHEMRPGLTLEIAGLYAHTLNQMRVNDINHPEPFLRTASNQVRSPQVANLSRPYRTYEGVLVRDIARIENTAESLYRSLDLGLTQRYRGRGRLGLHYVWSSSIAHSMFYADANSGVPDEWWPDWDRFEGGPSDFHQPHRLVADGSVRLPFGTQVSAVMIAASGLPVNPITGRDNNGDSYTVDRPVGLGRNSFRGPAQVNVDLAASKSFRLPGTLRAQARIEVFNLLNRDNFIRVNNIFGEGPAPLSTFLAPVAGITNADPARQVQFSVRMLF